MRQMLKQQTRANKQLRGRFSQFASSFINCIYRHIRQDIGLFGFASKKFNPVEDLKADEWNKFGIETKYYNTELHKGAFALPNYVKDLIK